MAPRNAHHVERRAKTMITIVIVASAFLAVVIVGVIALLRAGIAREESDRSLLGDPATLATAATRRVVGLYVRTPERTTRAGRYPGQGGAWHL
jgi:hypothetical protein